MRPYLSRSTGVGQSSSTDAGRLQDLVGRGLASAGDGTVNSGSGRVLSSAVGFEFGAASVHRNMSAPGMIDPAEFCE